MALRYGGRYKDDRFSAAVASRTSCSAYSVLLNGEILPVHPFLAAHRRTRVPAKIVVLFVTPNGNDHSGRYLVRGVSRQHIAHECRIKSSLRTVCDVFANELPSRLLSAYPRRIRASDFTVSSASEKAVVVLRGDGNGAEELELLVRGLEAAEGVGRFDGFVRLTARLAFVSRAWKRGVRKHCTTGTANDQRTPSGGRTVSLSQRITTVRVASARI